MVFKLELCAVTFETVWFCTLERLIASVNSHMCFEVLFFGEPFVADLAYLWFDAKMRIFMNFQSFRSFETLATNFAAVGFFAGVILVVHSKIAFGLKFLITAFKFTFESSIF